MTAPLLNTICSSRPSSRIVSSTTVLHRLPAGDDAAANRQRMHAALAQPRDERLGRRRCKHRFATSAGLIEQGTVLGHDQIAAAQLGERALQVRQLAPGDQDQTATGILEPLERRESVGIDHAVLRQRAIVVRGEGQKVHGSFQRPVGSGSNVKGSAGGSGRAYRARIRQLDAMGGSARNARNARRPVRIGRPSDAGSAGS